MARSSRRAIIAWAVLLLIRATDAEDVSAKDPVIALLKAKRDGLSSGHSIEKPPTNSPIAATQTRGGDLGDAALKTRQNIAEEMEEPVAALLKIVSADSQFPGRSSRLSAAPKLRSPALAEEEELAAKQARRAVRAPSLYAASDSGLAARGEARSLQDWQMEDFVLLATVDGSIHARDRLTGAARWELEAEHPMLESVYHRHNGSTSYDPLWIVEPSLDGDIYVYEKGILQKLQLTVKQLVADLSPYESIDPAVVYNGEKRTHLYTVDASSGRISKVFGTGAAVQPGCPRPGGLSVGIDECRSSPSFVLGRTEYTITIQDRETTEPICTLKYFEWGPNTRDGDLHGQYLATMDDRYVYPLHDGSVVGWEMGRHAFYQRLSSPVVRVFDVARPAHSDEQDSQLVILPQPLGPIDSAAVRASLLLKDRIFVNKTEAGGWFAMSENAYPLIATKAKPALCYDGDHGRAEQQASFIGVHALSSLQPPAEPPLTISDRAQNDALTPALPPLGSSRILTSFADNAYDILIVAVVLLVSWAIVNRHKIPRAFAHMKLSNPLLIAPSPTWPKEEVPIIAEEGPTVQFTEPVPKKKARRGARGGIKHKKKTVDETPQVLAGSAAEMADPSAPLQLGHLTIFTDCVLGFGGHGTVVYKGRFGGRDVAVKRMLREFYDIASHEVGLLQESDDHANVIRYYDKEEDQQFFYIALELCPASLQDVVERPRDFPLVPLDKPEMLRQITNGLGYLHSLKIVHRDIKPQNILVSAPRANPLLPAAEHQPRLLISDFGLCKKLEADQNSFRATTAHAAGTSGWRAPELLFGDPPEETTVVQEVTGPVPDIAPDTIVLPATGLNPPAAVMVSAADSLDAAVMVPAMRGDCKPEALTVQQDEKPPDRRTATRAIDIFSLGCVFYYCLTNGAHPFDTGDRYMREANIVKGAYDIEALGCLGDYQWEAKDIISWMIQMEPQKRPDASSILRHPFFWSANKRLDFLCDVSDGFEHEKYELDLYLKRHFPDKQDARSEHLDYLESCADQVLNTGDFLRALPHDFVQTLGKQRKYRGHSLLDLLRALRNKRSHFEDMPEELKRRIGGLPEGYLTFWTRRFPNLLLTCWKVVEDVEWVHKDRFRRYYQD